MVSVTIKQPLHPNAYLSKVRNIRKGLYARTKILLVLDIQGFSASKIALKSALSYAVVVHHLNLLKNEGIVERRGNKRYFWLLTGLGQKRL